LIALAVRIATMQAATLFFDLGSLNAYSQVDMFSFDLVMNYMQMELRRPATNGVLEVVRVTQLGDGWDHVFEEVFWLRDLLIWDPSDRQCTEGPLRLVRKPIALEDGPVR